MNYALITGGLGFIGSQIAHRLFYEKLVDRVILLDHYGEYVSPVKEDYSDYRKLRLKGIEDKVIVERGEARYTYVLTDIITRYRPEYIFHLAALPLAKIDNINAEEAMEGSNITTVNIFEVCGFLKKYFDYEPKRIIYTSSSMVYGDFEYTPADEKHPTNPKEIYGTMKLAGEVMVRGLSNFYGFKSTIIRPSAVYGPTDMNRRVSQIFIEKAFFGKKLKISGRDEALDFTYVKDTAKGFVLAATHPDGVNQTFNITYGKAHTLLEYAMELKKYFPSLTYEIAERDSYRPKRGTLSIEKAKKILDYKPDYDLEKGIKEYVDFIKKYKVAFRGDIDED